MEILIVVVILGILASIVVPQFISAAVETRENSIRMDLHRIRSQLALYREQHGAWPTLADFADQMTMATSADGDTAPVGTLGYPFGPYFREVPINPNTGGTTVGDGAVGSSDWYYNQATGEFHANDSPLTRAF